MMKSQKVLVTVVLLLLLLFFFFAVLSLVFELKQNLEAKAYPEMNS